MQKIPFKQLHDKYVILIKRDKGPGVEIFMQGTLLSDKITVKISDLFMQQINYEKIN